MPPTLPEIGREAPATVCAPLVVSLPWRVTARCPIVDPDLAPGRSAIPVLVAAMVLTALRLLRFLVLGRSNSILLLGRSNSVLRLRRARGRDRCLPRPRRVALGAGAGSEKRHRCSPSLERRCGREQRQRLLGDGSSRGAERSSPCQFFPDCTIAMRGYDFREGHPRKKPSLQR